MLPVLISGCNSSEQQTHEGVEKLVNSVMETCDESVYSALYYSGFTDFFDSDSEPLPQPVHTFHETLSDSTKILILQKFEQHISNLESEENRNLLQSKIENWCRTKTNFQERFNQKSVEEVIAEAYNSGYYNHIFDGLRDCFQHLKQEYSTLDAVACLSSAEMNQLYADLVTETAQMDTTIKSP